MPYRVLLADDSPTIQKVVELLLSSENFEIKAVGDGEEALGLIDSFSPDIVLVDVGLPKINGYQLCERIKRNPATSSIPVILLTGAFEPFDKNYAKSALADDFITKPFESAELINKVKTLILNYESFKETQQWDEEVPVEETKEETEVINEDFESEIAIAEGLIDESKVFSEERGVTEKTKIEELVAMNIPSKEEIGDMLNNILRERISDVIDKNILPYISFSIKDSVESAVSSNAPRIIEEVSKSLIDSIKDDVRKKIEDVIPQIAEEIIKKEIERITAESQ
jgi:DNA-binding response OmpR family regulator